MSQGNPRDWVDDGCRCKICHIRRLAVGEYCRECWDRYDFNKDEKVDEITDVKKELTRARELHPNMQSAHEGYAVILEELDELWDEIKKRNPDKAKMREEAKHIAAMATRFMGDVCG